MSKRNAIQTPKLVLIRNMQKIAVPGISPLKRGAHNQRKPSRAVSWKGYHDDWEASSGTLSR